MRQKCVFISIHIPFTFSYYFSSSSFFSNGTRPCRTSSFNLYFFIHFRSYWILIFECVDSVRSLSFFIFFLFVLLLLLMYRYIKAHTRMRRWARVSVREGIPNKIRIYRFMYFDVYEFTIFPCTWSLLLPPSAHSLFKI